MKCSKCQFENRDGAKFCKDCGANLEVACLECGTVYELGSKFCDECGFKLDKEIDPAKSDLTSEGERKHVTVLFSDLSGYTTMSERLDPEEVKEVTVRIFSNVSKIVNKYDGFIEKYAGDAVMALFGAKQSHEDDPIRAIKAAIEIHAETEKLSPEYEGRIESTLRMHTGIYTGLVVTGELNMEKGIHGVAGDTLNVASRLSTVAKSGEILIGPVTFNRSAGHFNFEAMEPVRVKGKTEPIQIYKFRSIRDDPKKVHRLHGLRSELIGRKAEMAQLSEAVVKLKNGKGTVISINGAAGTGKSRLVEEFKTTLDLEKIQWREGHAHAYSQNIPYFPLINLINRTLQIEEGDSAEKVRQKIESRINTLIGENADVVPYIGSLYSLDYPEINNINPEFWKSKLQRGVLKVLTALAQAAPTIICLEDLHWADPSTLELVHFLISENTKPVLFICVYRPTISLFSANQIESMSDSYQELPLQDLSPSEALNMIESLLRTESIPSDLQQFIRNKVEGNPFYVEEAINSLIESKVLVVENGHWKITRNITESEISATIHGVIYSRVDRLERESKRILQEASVIGRSFYYEIIKRVTELRDNIDIGLSGLERLELIKTKSVKPDLEYIFKHALTQEVVYKGLLLKERQKIHERIGNVIEKLFKNRLPEFYETLAFHFKQSKSTLKAIDYLVKSGEKSLARYAVAEAHQYFQEAFDILSPKEKKSEEEKILIIDILNRWAYAYYYLGEIQNFIDLFKSHQAVADSLNDKAKVGMFYAWFGIAHFMAGKPYDSYGLLCKALELGESSGNQKVVGYACTWLPWACAELGFFAEGIEFGERARKIAESFPSDQYLFFKSLGGLCYINFLKGNTSKIFEGANQLLEYGERSANSRCKVFGHWMEAFGHWIAGDMKSSQKSCEKAIDVALDPAYSQFPRLSLGLAYFLEGQIQEAENALKLCINFCEKRGMGQITEIGRLFLAPTLIVKGDMKQGQKMLEEVHETFIRNHRNIWHAQSEYIRGKVKSQIATGPKPTVSIMAKNLGFLLTNVPFAGKKAEEHLYKAVETLTEIGAKGLLGNVYLDLGLLHKNNKRTNKAKECILEAIKTFRECEAEPYLNQAKEELEHLKAKI